MCGVCVSLASTSHGDLLPFLSLSLSANVSVSCSHLKKPRASEQKLLVQFAEVYDKWVHDKFLVLRNAQILAEERLESNRLQLTRYLHAIWAILARVNEGYAAYRQILNEIREKYFSEIVGVADGALGIFAKDLSVVI